MTKEKFGSKLGIIAAAAGSAVGLGNLWKFPYIVGNNGGGIFVILYIVLIFAVGLPVMISEFIIGRRGQGSAVGSFKNLDPKTPWYLSGVLAVITASIILSFYGVIAGWVLHYFILSITGGVSAEAGMSAEIFTDFISQPIFPIIYQVIFMVSVMGVVIAGVQKGIERVSKIMMPVLFILLIVLALTNLRLDGFGESMAFLFGPDTSKFGIQSILGAVGQAFFSLSLGFAAMITYGAYIKKDVSLTDVGLKVSIADLCVALLAALIIFPVVFTNGLEVGAGPGLVFITLPPLFEALPGGDFIAIAFFILLFLAAFTSAISLLEISVAAFKEKELAKKPDASDHKVRVKWVLICGGVITLLGFLSSLSQGAMDIVLPLPAELGETFLDQLSNVADYFLIPLGGLLATLFVGLRLKKQDVIDELKNPTLGKILHFYVKYIVPIFLVSILISGLYNLFIA